MEHSFDVAIVGCGPVGATLAVALGQQGIRVVAIERETSIHHLPRAVCLDGEVMRMYQGLGLAEGITRVSSPMRSFRYENEAGDRLIDWDIPQGKAGDQGWPATHMFHQPDVERLLRDEIAALPSVTLLDGHEVRALDQDVDGTTLVVEDLGGKTSRTITAAYAVGCDGGPSFTRKAIGSRFETLGPEQDWVVIDGVVKDIQRTWDGIPTGCMVGYCWPSRPHFFVPINDTRVRWEFMVLPDDDLDVIGTPEGGFALIERFATRDEVTLERSAIYKFRSLLAERWRVERVFLAGDAAHLQPPLRAQGLCSGIRDAINLSWKLGAVLKGEANDSLLDTYEAERRAHARAWIEIATELSNIINTTDPAVAAGRDAHLLANPMEYSNPTPPLGPGLHAEVIAPAGFLSEQLIQDDGTRLDDVVGPRFLVAMTPDVHAALSEQTRSALADGTWFYVVDPAAPIAAELLARHGGHRALVVRPDRYVLGVADDATSLEDLVGRWTAHLKEKVSH
ncbi:MAG TPA: bifunctional 3-(3-hydroxy-phenyl)propionate/3-hydroxycinnamic acid hydroxylase [Baekduia sp.]|nr:bifunctional 3-(3-hydroxy-phenyl)propionate/3-hydroxycinnamic acid hydroxylase [Baekduia sp.]